MLNIRLFQCNMLQENCYVVSDDSKECVIIDCGAFYPAEQQSVVSYVNDNGLTPRHLLATHGHFDHNFGNAALLEAFGLRPEVSRADVALIEQLDEQAVRLMGMRLNAAEQPLLGRLLADGDTVTFGTHTLHVIATPGHSAGSVVFHEPAEQVAFTGDTLFRMSIGRTVLDEGNPQQMRDSLARLMQLLPDATTIYPGHGPQSTIAEERRYNPYLNAMLS